MNILDYNGALRSQFEELLVTYFTVDLNSDIPEDIIRGKLMDLISKQTEDGVIHVAIATENDSAIGFSIYQIDSTHSDWCKRPGWGFIREFYIASASRSKGFGKALAAYTDAQLKILGSDHLYLTSDDAVQFWQKCGYSLTDEICSNDLPILEKHL